MLGQEGGGGGCGYPFSEIEMKINKRYSGPER